ncbi:hypothetical protein FRB96_000633 [Tulasnella sp. 330]|nr:hypothetical protein FRB96_000633 [Tulasnella sp. 330]KAG8880999.1 hypothetical protein FRB97_000244 [Tulasnella sp. 331]KAG8887435.1 hypothetical protein FRB98_009635 [Tulasnella sp. 332]
MSDEKARLASDAITPSGRFLDYVFPFDTFNGPLQDPTNGRAEYLIETPLKFIGKGATTVIRPDGTKVGSIKWRGSFELHKMVTLHGQTAQGDQMLKTLRDALFEDRKRVWVDDWGNQFYWQTRLCYNAENQIMARYLRGKKHTFRDNEPAWLSIDTSYMHLFDHILFTAIMIEHETRQSEESSSSSSGGGGDGGGAC